MRAARVPRAAALLPNTWTRRTTRMFPTSLFREHDGVVECLACVRRCHLHEGQVGKCAQVGCHENALHNLAYGVIAEASVTPIESKPVYHYWPGARTLSLGGLGCNLLCKFCQNWEIAFRDARDAAGLEEPNLTADDAVALALAQQCQGLSWSHNEPSITPTYVLDSARAARRAGLFTVLVTNGLLTDAAIETLGPWIDVYRVDVKSLDPAFYQRIADIGKIGDTLHIAARAQDEFGAYVEAVTNVMPGFNDSDDSLARIAEGIASSLGAQTPWHLTTFIPYALMRHVPTTPYTTLRRAHAIGQAHGLRFIYIDHPEASGGADTHCPECGAPAIKRLHGHTALSGVTAEGCCAACGGNLHLVLPAPSAISAPTTTGGHSPAPTVLARETREKGSCCNA